MISSLPLGVLKKNVVKFVPELPDKYKIAIDTIGNGMADKLFVTFAEPFIEGIIILDHLFTRSAKDFNK